MRNSAGAEPTSYYIRSKHFDRSVWLYNAAPNEALMNYICENFFFPLSKGVEQRYGSGHTDPEDVIQEGVIKCVARISRYDKTKGRAFSFFTRIVQNRGKDCKRSSYRRRKHEIPMCDLVTEQNEEREQEYAA